MNINFYKIRKNMIYITAYIFKKKYLFLVDTGSERSYISPQKKLNQYRTELPYVLKIKGIGRDTLVKFKYLIPTLQIGDLFFENISFHEKKEKNILFKLLGIDGIVGWDILKTIDFTINMASRKVEILDPKFTETAIKFISLQNFKLPVYDMDSHENALQHFMIDTGSNYSFIYDPLYQGEAQTKRSISIGINGIRFSEIFLLKNLTVSPKKGNNGGFEVKDILLEKMTNTYPLVLGLSAFQHHNLLFANSENTLYVGLEEDNL